MVPTWECVRVGLVWELLVQQGMFVDASSDSNKLRVKVLQAERLKVGISVVQPIRGLRWHAQHVHTAATHILQLLTKAG